MFFSYYAPFVFCKKARIVLDYLLGGYVLLKSKKKFKIMQTIKATHDTCHLCGYVLAVMNFSDLLRLLCKRSSSEGLVSSWVRKKCFTDYFQPPCPIIMDALVVFLPISSKFTFILVKVPSSCMSGCAATLGLAGVS